MAPAPPPDRPRRIVLGVALAALAGLAIWGFTVMGPGNGLSGDEWARLSYALGFMALVSASLFARRLRLGQAVRYALIWMAIIAALLLGYTFRDRLGLAGGEPALSQQP
jgi:drug/metabolite transporter (DMT)-like permease